MAAPGSFTAGSVLTAAEMNNLPGGVVTVANAAANPIALTTSETTVATASPTLSTGRSYMLLFNGYFYNNSVSGAQYFIKLYVGGGLAAQLVKDTTSATERNPVAFAWSFFVGSTGATTVELKAAVSTGTGGISSGSTANLRYALVDVGPTP